MADFKIMRNGLNTEIVGDPHIGQSSEDVTVEVTDDGTYQGYDKKLYYSYGYRNQIYRAIADENSSNEFVIPMTAFLEPGIVRLSLELSNGTNKPTCNACFIIATNGAKSVAASDILPDEKSWQSYIQSYIKSNAEEFKGDKGNKGDKGEKGEQGTPGKDAVSISDIKKTSTSGLTDTYEITLTDGTKRTFNVNNGKGIKSIAKTSTSGLTDTYTITYNDGTTSTFTVNNGEKGETGDVSKENFDNSINDLTDLISNNRSRIDDAQNGIKTANSRIDNLSAEVIDARTGYDGTAYPTLGTAIRTQVSELKGDLGDLKSKFEVVSESFVNKCSIIRNNTPNNFLGNKVTGVKEYFDFGKNAKLTKIKTNIKASNDDTAVLEIATLDGNIIATKEKAVTTEYTDVVFDLDNDIKEPVSVFVYTKEHSLLSYADYGTPYENPSFSYIFPDGTRKLAFKFDTLETIKPTTSKNKQCLVFFFDYTSNTINNITDSISQNIDTTLSESGKSADAKVVGDKLSKLEENINSNNAHTIFVSTSGSDETGDGTEENPYATIYHANETITDNSETNKYRIIVKQGTYTDLQEKYAGIDGTYYQGVICKSYVTYESEDVTRPDLCILKWDGSVGYTKPVTDANCVNKCLFHIKDNSQGVYIKGFTFVSKNTRYCMHVETVGSTKACDWHFENCVFEWGGRPDTKDDGTVATSCIGTGWSLMEHGEFVNCIIKCTNTNHANHMVFQTHGNVDTGFSSIKRGEYIKFINCYFSVADGSEYAHVDLRNTKANPTIPSFIEFINCVGNKLYVPSDDYKKNFVCTEQHN